MNRSTLELGTEEQIAKLMRASADDLPIKISKLKDPVFLKAFYLKAYMKDKASILKLLEARAKELGFTLGI